MSQLINHPYLRSATSPEGSLSGAGGDEKSKTADTTASVLLS